MIYYTITTTESAATSKTNSTTFTYTGSAPLHLQTVGSLCLPNAEHSLSYNYYTIVTHVYAYYYRHLIFYHLSGHMV